MDIFLAPAVSVAETVLPIAFVFIALAVATKRRRAVEAFRRCRRESLTNAGLLLVNYILLAPLLVVPVLAVEAALPEQAWLKGLWRNAPELLTLIAAILLIDFAAYWRHRAEHDPGLWRFHATHHADEHLHWLTVIRKHPVSKLLSMLADNLPVLLLGFPLWAIAAANLLRSWWGYFIHADMPWTLGPLGRVLVSPAAHRLHHIRDEELMGSNYGNTVTLWDRLFGTWIDPEPHIGCETGIEEGTRGLWGELARPWEKRYRERGEGEPKTAELAIRR